jgi:small subunit ribosomal protein S13
MARIAGINIPTHKHIVIGLQSIFGIGETRSKQICETLKLDPTTKVSALTEGELEEIRGVIAQFQVEGDLRREVAMNIKRLRD